MTSKMLTAPFFPHNDNPNPVKMPAIFYDHLAELDFVDLYTKDFQIEDEESWLSGLKPRAISMTKSTSLGALSSFGFMEADGDDGGAPRHSTPVGKGKSMGANGAGLQMNGTHVSPISQCEDSPSDLNRTFVGSGEQNAVGNRTFGKEENGESRSPDENRPQMNRTQDKVPSSNGLKNHANIPNLPVVKQSSIPPVSRGGLRPPSRPPVTVRPKSTMNRTSSLEILSSNRKMSIPDAGRTAQVVPANAVRGPPVVQNGQPKIGPLTRSIRPPGAKLPVVAPSRIPIPKVAKK